MADLNAYRSRMDQLLRLKPHLPRQLLATVDVMGLSRLSDSERRNVLRASVMRLCVEHGIEPAGDELDVLTDEAFNELFGYGPLDPLMVDPDVSDILVNGPNHVYVERDGILHGTDISFPDEQAVTDFIKRLVGRMDRRIDESSPMVDLRLPDGSRLNAVIPPLSIRGPALSIRRFRPDPLVLEEMVQFNSLTNKMAEFLVKAVQGRTNILISGSTGAGKTTLLNALSRFIPISERIITIEQTAELQLQQPDVVSLQGRPPNIEGKGEIEVRDLLKNCLRMRPDRIIAGECRGPEVFEVLQAMITGHDGSMSTIHASDTREALHRMELMIALSGVELPKHSARQYISAAIHMLVHMKRLSTGERKIVQITELAALNDDQYELRDIFVYNQRGVDRFGRANGEFSATGYTPRVLDRMEMLGIECPKEMFEAPDLPSVQSHQA